MMRFLCLLFVSMTCSCAAPIAGVWPPAPGEPSYRIEVAQDAWHSIITLWPESDPKGASSIGKQEWGYADRSFYLDGHSGCSGTCGALFWPTEGVLRVAPGGASLHVQADQPARRWSFRLSAEGRRRLIAFLEGEKAAPGPISHVARSDWYLARPSYHVFHHCAHWTARAVRAAGLPVWSGYSLFGWSLAAQLDRAKSFQDSRRP